MNRFNLFVSGLEVASEVGADRLAAMVVAVSIKYRQPVEVQPVRQRMPRNQELVTVGDWTDEV